MKRFFQVSITLVILLSLFIPSGLSGVKEAAAADPVDFAVVTDYGTGTVAAMINGWSPDFIVTAGDNYQGISAGSQYPTYVGNYYGSGATPNWMSPVNFYPVPGNHDYYPAGGSLTGTNSYTSYFSYLPPTGAYTGSTATYYDFVRGPVHFFMLNTGNVDDVTPDSATQQTWLTNALAASTSPWNIVMFHMPAASGGASHGSDTGIQWDFAGMGADFVISGHNHVYERIDWNGITYFTAGAGGGNARTDWNASYLPSGAVAQDHYGSSGDTLSGAMRVNASDTSITFEYITTNATVQDTATYTLQAEQSCTTVSFQQGTAGYAGAIDNHIMQYIPTYNYGNTTPLLIDSDEPNAQVDQDVSSLLYWDISSIPSGSTIQSASITLNIDGTYGYTTSPGFDMYAMTQAWTEGTGNGSATGNGATWNTYNGSSTWPGGAGGSGDRGTIVLANFTPTSTSTPYLYTSSLNSNGVSVIQDWVNTPANNKGFMIFAGANSDGMDFTSSEGTTVSNRPKLTIEYCTAAAEATIEKSVNLTTASPGEVLTYTVDKIGYPGTDLLSSVTVTDTIPTGTTYVMDSDTPEATEGAGTLTWELGSNAAGTPGTATTNQNISVSGPATSFNTANSVSSVSFTHSTGSATNRLLLVGVSWADNQARNIIGVTYNGVALGEVGHSYSDGNGGDYPSRRIAIYRMIAPPTLTNASVIVTFSNTTTGWPNYDTTVDLGIIAGAITFGGVNQSDPLRNFVGATGTDTTQTVSVATVANDWVFDTVVGRYNLTGGTNQSVLWNALPDIRGAASTKVATGASTTMSWSSTNTTYAIGAVPIVPAGGTRTTTLSASKSLMSTGTFTLTATMINTAADTNVTPTALTSTVTGGASVSCGLPSPASGNISAGGSLVFTWTCTPTAGTTLPSSVALNVSATGNSFSYPSGRSNTVLIIPPLRYQVTVNDPSSQATVTNSATLDDSGTYIAATASNTVTTNLVSRLGNLVWWDVDYDGYKDVSEPGIAGVVVDLYKSDGTRAYIYQESTTTGSNGAYTFLVATTGDYQVQIPASNFASGGALYGYIQSEDTYTIDDTNKALPYNYTRTTSFSNVPVADFGFYPIPTADETVSGPDVAITDEHIQVTWQTVNEVDILGFRLYRDGQSENELIHMRSAEYTGKPMGYSYIFNDLAVDPLGTHVYWLEVVTTHGAYFLQPRLVNPYRIYMPTVRQ